MTKKSANNFIFFDSSGSRWQKLKSLIFTFVAIFTIAVLIAMLSLFGEKRDLLQKKVGDTNFDVVANISMQDEKKIIVDGSGTFGSINLGQNGKDYKLSREGSTDEKLVVLSFDDGPHPVYTRQIMNILEKENVPGSFFLLGESILKNPEVAKEVSNRGFEIGNHTFSHKDEEFADYTNKKGSSRLDFEINFTDNLITAITGKETKLFRTPFWGAEDEISVNTLGLITFSTDKGYTVSSPTLDSLDWDKITPKQIVKNATTVSKSPVVILFHDAGGDRNNTVLALPEVIKYYKDNGYKFVTIDDLTSKVLVENAPIYKQVSSNILVFGYNFSKNFLNYLSPVFLFGLAFALIYSIVVVLLSFLQVIRFYLTKKALKSDYHPQVTVIVPAFNEEKVIARTIKSILNSTYENFKVLIVDDGSTDRTFEIASRFKKHGLLRVIHRKNSGKYSALNYGIKFTSSEIFVAIDADTQILKDTLNNMVRFFQDKKVGAVAGNVKVGNANNLLGIFQTMEYTLSLNMERNAYSLLNSMLVIPGALGAWRTESVKNVGGYSGNTLTEDAELTLRLLRDGYKLIYDRESIAYTEAPEKVAQLYRQRFRWTFGVFQTLFHHKDLIFKKNQSFLGLLVMPFTIFIQIPVMLLTPLMDILALYYIFFVSSETVGLYSLVYLLARMVIGLMAFIISNDNPWPLLFMPFSRFFYQPLLYASTYSAFFTALKGAKPGWGKSERFNSVRINP